jgi:hypothetical protein
MRPHAYFSGILKEADLFSGSFLISNFFSSAKVISVEWLDDERNAFEGERERDLFNGTTRQ